MNEIKRVLQEMRERRVNNGRNPSPTLHEWADRIEAALTGSAQDEREAFEAWRLEKFCGGAERLKKCSNAPEVYYYAAEQEAWKTWRQAWRALLAAPIAQTAPQGKFRMGDLVKKTGGSEWVGHVCGTYSTALTPEGYAVESEAHAGSVQIYPAKALEAV